MRPYLEFKNDQVLIKIYAQPNAPKTQIVGEHAGELKIKVNAVPEDGKANKEIIYFLSKATKVAKSNWVLVRGQASRHKVFALSKASFDQISKEFWL